MLAADEPITLQAACGLWPDAKLTVSALRAEAARGRLTVFRLGRRDMTTLADMQRMVELCRADAPHRGSTSILAAGNGSSATDPSSSAQAALKQTVKALKNISPTTLPTNTSLNGARPR
jgi:hypothetical protein